MSHGSKSDYDEQHAGYGWLMFCVIGMVSSLTLYGIVLEFCTSGGRKLHEWSFVFITTSIYATTAYVARSIIGEKQTEVSKYNMLLLSLTSIASTFTSVRSLRYVIYPVQILFKSCKPVPVMVANIIFGRKYKLTKYVNVIIITAGVALFMGGGDATQKSSKTTSVDSTGDTTLIGALLLSLSLCFDGATGAYEDKLMSKNHMEPFDLMFNIQLGKAVMSFCILVASNGLNELFQTLDAGGFSLVLLGLTGALGQVFVFVTISKFGALNCALIGLCRKMLSLILSFLLYGHVLNAFQTVGLSLSIAAMIANFYEKGGSKKDKNASRDGAAIGKGDVQAALQEEKKQLLAPSEDEDDGEETDDLDTVEMSLKSAGSNTGQGDVSLLDMDYTDQRDTSYHDLPDPEASHDRSVV